MSTDYRKQAEKLAHRYGPIQTFENWPDEHGNIDRKYGGIIPRLNWYFYGHTRREVRREMKELRIVCIEDHLKHHRLPPPPPEETLCQICGHVAKRYKKGDGVGMKRIRGVPYPYVMLAYKCDHGHFQSTTHPENWQTFSGMPTP